MERTKAAMTASLLTHIYLISTGLGSVYILYSFLTGQFGGGDGSIDDSPDGDASGDFDNDAGGDADDLSDGLSVKGHAGQALTVTINASSRRLNPGKLVVAMLSPMTMSMFLTFFGLTGLIVSSVAGFLGPLTALVAGIIGLIVTSFILRSMSSMSKKLLVTSAAKPQDMIGQVAKVTVSIEAGGIGRIVYSMLGMRCTAMAKSAQKDSIFKTGSTVIISDFQNRVAIVEDWPAADDLQSDRTGQ